MYTTPSKCAVVAAHPNRAPIGHFHETRALDQYVRASASLCSMPRNFKATSPKPAASKKEKRSASAAVRGCFHARRFPCCTVSRRVKRWSGRIEAGRPRLAGHQHDMLKGRCEPSRTLSLNASGYRKKRTPTPRKIRGAWRTWGWRTKTCRTGSGLLLTALGRLDHVAAVHAEIGSPF